MADERLPDVIIAPCGGGSNLGGLSLPFVEDTGVRLVAVEPSSCQTLTEGRFDYDFGDTAGMTPLLPMYTLGHEFMPPTIHAGGLRYHGDAPIISALVRAGARASLASPQGETPLMAASKSGNIQAVKMLLEAGAEPNALTAFQQETAMMWAAAEGHDAVIQALLDAKGRAGIKRATTAGHLLRGKLLACAHCGATMHARTDRGRGWYVCATKLDLGLDAACPMPRVPREAVEGPLLAYFRDSILDLDATRAQIEQATARQVDEARALREHAERHLRGGGRRPAAHCFDDSPRSIRAHPAGTRAPRYP